MDDRIYEKLNEIKDLKGLLVYLDKQYSLMSTLLH